MTYSNLKIYTCHIMLQKKLYKLYKNVFFYYYKKLNMFILSQDIIVAIV